MDRFAHGVVAAEAERDVRDAAGDLRAGQFRLDPLRGLDVLDGVPVVLGNAGRDGEDVRVEDDVLGREARRLGQEAVGALGDRDLALGRVRLALLVEGHDDDRRPVAADPTGVLEEDLLALLERDRVDDALALGAPQAGLDDLELRGIDHQRHPADVGFGCDQADEPGHRGGRVEHRLVEVHVDQLGAVLDLLAGDRHGLVETIVEDQLARTCATRSRSSARRR